MKRIIKAVIITLLLIFMAAPLTAFAEDVCSTEVNDEFDEILEENGVDLCYSDIEGITFGELTKKIGERLPDIRTRPMRLLGAILLVTVLSAAVRSVGGDFIKSGDNIFNSVSVLAASAIIAPYLMEVFQEVLASVRAGGDFLAVFIPVFTGITAATGGIMSAGIYDLAVLAASEMIVQLSAAYLMPVVSASTVLSVTGSIFSDADLSGIVRLLKKVVTWGMTIVMTLFTGFVAFKCSLAGKADSAATKAARLVISGFVPVVGGAVSDAYATVRSSFDIVRGTVGTGGCIAILLLLLPPVIQIMAIRLVMWTGAAAAEIFGEKNMHKLLDSLDSGLAIAQSVLVCYGVMFLLCTAILMQTAG